MVCGNLTFPRGKFDGSGHEFKERVVSMIVCFSLAIYVSLRADTEYLVGFNPISVKWEEQVS